MNLSKIFLDSILSQFDTEYKDNIVVFGAGQNGIQLKKYLLDNQLNVNFFCDNDKTKHGKLIDGIPCISFVELCKYKENTLVIVSPIKSEEINKILKDNKFCYIPFDGFWKIAKFIPITNIPNAYNYFPQIGHFYSLYPNLDEIIGKSEILFNNNKKVLDIDLNEKEQLIFLHQMIDLYNSIPKWEDISVELGTTPLRYRLKNSALSAGDAIGLHCMLRLLKPKRMIEVGSGFSSAVTLDTNEFYLKNQVQLTFIEPYPKTLKAILKETDQVELIQNRLQDVSFKVFEKLESGDILFIDSTHVSKIDSDVNYLFFEILPRLKKGVYIHLHDIFYPFEYPKQWIVDGKVWNELYLLRAFLQNNSNFSIVFFHNMLEQKYSDIFMKNWPLKNDIHGGSIWLRKKADI